MTTSPREPALVLWDIDRTLLSIGGEISRAIYERAFHAVTGRQLGELADMAGRTDRAITADTLRLNGVDEPDVPFPAFCAALGSAAEELAGRMREVGTVLPGARAAVAALAGRRTVQSLVTGNIRSIAAVKLGSLDLARHLDLGIGGYGEDGRDRADLVRLARERAAAKHGSRFAGRRTFVIGDTPHDVKGAHDAGAFAIGVATGRSSDRDLEEAGADVVLPDLTGLDTLLDAVLG